MDYLAFGKNCFNRYAVNLLPAYTSPFVIKKISLNGVSVTFATHRNDRVLGARLRKELKEDRLFLSELHLLQKMIKPGNVVLDAGANMGSVAIVLAKVQPDAKIYCFEPDPVNYSLLNVNIELNNIKNIIPFNIALGKKQEFIKMYLSPKNFGDHRSSKFVEHDLGEDEFRESRNCVIKMNPIDVLKNSCGINTDKFFDIVKIDTQGADFEILDTCLPMLKKGAKVTIEYSPYHLHAHGTTKDEVIRVVSSFTSIERILPKGCSYMLKNISIRNVEDFYDTEHKTYRGYFDMLLTL